MNQGVAMSIEYFKGHDVSIMVSWTPATRSIFLVNDATALREYPNYNGQPENIPIPGGADDISVAHAKARADWFLGSHGWRPTRDWIDINYQGTPISTREYRWLPGV
jgi:hypothetical protein